MSEYMSNSTAPKHARTGIFVLPSRIKRVTGMPTYMPLRQTRVGLFIPNPTKSYGLEGDEVLHCWIITLMDEAGKRFPWQAGHLGNAQGLPQGNRWAAGIGCAVQ